MANVIALADAGGVGEGEMRKVTFADGAFDFGEGAGLFVQMRVEGFRGLAGRRGLCYLCHGLDFLVRGLGSEAGRNFLRVLLPAFVMHRA